MTQLPNVLITDNSSIKKNYRWSKHPIIVSFLRQIYGLWVAQIIICKSYYYKKALLLCWFDHFLDSRAEICHFFSMFFFEKFKTWKSHSEINWPLKLRVQWSMWITISNIYLGLGFEFKFGPQRIRDLAILCS